MLKNRLAYLFTLVVVVIFVILNEGPMTYLALYSVIGLPLVSLAFAWFTRHHYALTARLSQEMVYKEEMVDYTLTFTNRSLLPFPSVQIHFNKTHVGIQTDIASLAFAVLPFKSHEAVFHLTPTFRGSYEVGASTLLLYDFLGLFKFKRPLTHAVTLLVQPQTKAINGILLPPAPQGLLSEKNQFQDEDYSVINDLRQYQPTDGYKKIHWKASARKNELMSKNFQQTRKASATFVLDNSFTALEQLGAHQRLALEDTVMEVYVSVLKYLTAKQFAITLSHIGHDARLETSSFESLYNIASGVVFEPNTTFEGFFKTFLQLQIETDNLIVFVKRLSPELVMTLQTLLGTGNHLTVIYFDERDHAKLAPANQLTSLYYKDLLQHTP